MSNIRHPLKPAVTGRHLAVVPHPSTDWEEHDEWQGQDLHASLPVVTVLVTSYNHERFIEESILSVINQNYPNIQLIVIDDGSSDSSPDIIKHLANSHGFKYVLQQNVGLAAALNRGISLAEGKYFVMLSADDVALPSRLKKQVAVLEARRDVAVCGGYYIEIDEDGSVIKMPKQLEARDLNFEDLFTRRKEGIKAPTAMMRTAVLRSVEGYDPDIHLEDIYMWLKITGAGHKAHVMAEPLAYYRKHAGNQSRNMAFMLDHYEKIYRQYEGYPGYERIINRIYINLFNKAVKKGYPGAWAVFRKVKLRHYTVKHVTNIVIRLYQLLTGQQVD